MRDDDPRRWSPTIARMRLCESKAKLDAATAKRKVDEIRRRERTSQAEAWLCEFCGHYHMGHYPKGKPRY